MTTAFGELLLALLLSLGTLALVLGYAVCWFLWPVHLFVLTFLFVALVLAVLVWMRRERERALQE